MAAPAFLPILLRLIPSLSLIIFCLFPSLSLRTAVIYALPLWSYEEGMMGQGGRKQNGWGTLQIQQQRGPWQLVKANTARWCCTARWMGVRLGRREVAESRQIPCMTFGSSVHQSTWNGLCKSKGKGVGKTSPPPASSYSLLGATFHDSTTFTLPPVLPCVWKAHLVVRIHYFQVTFSVLGARTR